MQEHINHFQNDAPIKLRHAMHALALYVENVPELLEKVEALITKVKQNDHAGFYLKEVAAVDQIIAFCE